MHFYNVLGASTPHPPNQIYNNENEHKNIFHLIYGNNNLPRVLRGFYVSPSTPNSLLFRGTFISLPSSRVVMAIISPFLGLFTLHSKREDPVGVAQLHRSFEKLL